MSMSEVSGGPGWWVASDGRWYPPELHPGRTPPVAPAPAGPPGAPPPGATPGDTAPGDTPEYSGVGAGAAPRFFVPPVVPDLTPGYVAGAGEEATPAAPPVPATGIPETRPRPSASPWASEDPWRDADRVTFGSRRPIRSTGLRATVDPRGAFVAVLSLLLVAACFLPYYRVTVIRGSGSSASTTFTVMAHAFGTWRLCFVVVAGLCVITGIVNSALRVGHSGAVAVFFVMRILVVGQLGLWIAAAADRSSKLALGVPAGVVTTTTVTWLAIVAIGLALGAVGGSLASIGRR